MVLGSRVEAVASVKDGFVLFGLGLYDSFLRCYRVRVLHICDLGLVPKP